MAALVNNRNTSIEFIVKPKQDLHLEGALRRLPRVVQGEAYPCQMQKTQNFSCLFRHYAKHNGLRKEDLVFTFVDELLPEQTPETVHLMPQDEIWVEHRSVELVVDQPVPAETVFSDNFKTLLDTGKHSDITFIVGENAVEFEAHKAILSARSAYFDAMFGAGMSESQQKSITYKATDAGAFRRMLEYLYTDSIKDLKTCTAQELISLLELANEYLMQGLSEQCEKCVSRVISVSTISKFLLLSAGHNDSILRAVCSRFVQENIGTIGSDFAFRQEVESCPELGLLLFEASMSQNDSSSSQQDGRGSFESNKRRRVTADPNSEIEQDQPASNTIAQTNANVNDY